MGNPGKGRGCAEHGKGSHPGPGHRVPALQVLEELSWASRAAAIPGPWVLAKAGLEAELASTLLKHLLAASMGWQQHWGDAQWSCKRLRLGSNCSLGASQATNTDPGGG